MAEMQVVLPNLYGFATKELAQDATIAYILAWGDPTYRESHPRLHALGTELLRSLLWTQEIDLPLIETLDVETQIDRIDILARINKNKNANRIILLIEDKVSTSEHSNQIERYKEAAEKRYSGSYDHLVAVYLKTGNESKEYLPRENECGRFLRRDLLDVLNKFQDTKNVIVDDFRIYLQRWEDDTNRWKSECYREWQCEQSPREGFYTALESVCLEKGDWCGWGYYANPAGGFLAFWLYGEQKGQLNWVGTQCRHVELFMQIHDAMRLTVRLGHGNAMDRVHNALMWQVFEALGKVNEENNDDIRIQKAGRFRGGKGAAVADVIFSDNDQDPWFAVDTKGIVNIDATIKRLRRVQELLQKVVKHLNEHGAIS